MELPANLVLIGLHSERPRSGKTTVACALAPVVGGAVYSIADGVRTVAHEMGMAGAADAAGDAKDVPLAELDGRTPRQVLIQIGETRCAMHGREYWLRRLIARIVEDAAASARRLVGLPLDHVAVIDDVRRLEEGRLIVDLGGTVCTITREGAPDVVDINGWSSDVFHTFRNDATPFDCAQKVWGRALMNRRRR